MLSTAFLLLQLMTPPPSGAQAQSAQPQTVKALVKDVADSGRCVTLADSPETRVAPPQIVPAGRPPLLEFRYYEAKAHHRAGSSELMLDDAGH